jgi:hypothetical protein
MRFTLLQEVVGGTAQMLGAACVDYTFPSGCGTFGKDRGAGSCRTVDRRSPANPFERAKLVTAERRSRRS